MDILTEAQKQRNPGNLHQRKIPLNKLWNKLAQSMFAESKGKMQHVWQEGTLLKSI